MLKIFLIIICLLLISKCNYNYMLYKDRYWITEGETMGTNYRVVVVTPSVKAIIGLKQAIQQQLMLDNYQISTWQPNSILSNFNKYNGTHPKLIPSRMAKIISTSLDVGIKTNGAMDITIGHLVNFWGFGPDKRTLITIPNTKTINKLLKKVGLKHLKLIKINKNYWIQKDLPNLLIDLSTVGEGYATDNLAILLKKRGIKNYLVSVGGAISTSGLSSQKLPWRIAIQKPTDKKISIQAIVDLKGHSISTSGSYRNYYRANNTSFTHIINPITGRPIEHPLVSATVIAKTALEADSWDTGLMVLGIEKAKQLALNEKLAVFLISKNDNNEFQYWISPQFLKFLTSIIDKNCSL